MNKPMLLGTLLCFTLTGCGSTANKMLDSAIEKVNDVVQTTDDNDKADETNAIKLVKVTPFIEDHNIQTNILEECSNLGSQLSTFTHDYMESRGFDAALQETVNKDGEGRNLVLTIIDAKSHGAAFAGHRKSVTVKAELYKDGVLVDKYVVTRGSRGGLFGGFKSSCSVLGRCVKALGSDVSVWLEKLSHKG